MSEQFGRYQTHFKIGPDSYLADDPLLGRKVLIQTGPAGNEALLQWARKLGAAGGPLVQRLLDLGIQAEKSYLVREVVEGRSLEEIGPEPKLLQPLLEALDHIHRAGLQHGDLRPANAILTPDGVLRLTNLCFQGRDDGEALQELKLWFAG